MDEVFLITDLDTPLGKELAKLTLQKGYLVLGTISPDGEGNDEQKLEKVRISIEGKKVKETLKIEVWRRHSPVSARHVLLKLLTHFNHISNVILLGNPIIGKYELKQIPIQKIESMVDGWIKGNFFFVKELFNHFFHDGNKSNLALVCQNYDNKPPCSLSEVLRGSFISLTTVLLADDETAKQKGMIVNGFDSYQESELEYAEFIFNTLFDKGSKLSGKWFKQHSGIISRLTKR